MILLWGLTGDGPFDAVRAALERRGAQVAVLDQRHVTRVRVAIRIGDVLTGRVELDDLGVDLAEVSAAYWRTYDLRRVLEGRDDLPRRELEAFAVEDSLAAWLDSACARIVNRPTAMASNNSKPYQGETLRRHGFDIPATLITTDRHAAERFWTDHGAVIYKSISGMRSIVARLTMDHLRRLDDIAWCPTQFQQFVPGRDFRVHVVGAEVFACEVESGADDYRYAARSGQPAELEAASVPDDVAQRCVDVTRALGLSVAGIDLRQAPDGRWFAFEVNPSPGFTYYEAHTNQPIADAIAAFLASA